MFVTIYTIAQTFSSNKFKIFRTSCLVYFSVILLLCGFIILFFIQTPILLCKFFRLFRRTTCLGTLFSILINTPPILILFQDF
jgi:hypothetical protein